MPVAKRRLADRLVRDSFDLWQVRRQFKQRSSLLKLRATPLPRQIGLRRRTLALDAVQAAARRGAACTCSLRLAVDSFLIHYILDTMGAAGSSLRVHVLRLWCRERWTDE